MTLAKVGIRAAVDMVLHAGLPSTTSGPGLEIEAAGKLTLSGLPESLASFCADLSNWAKSLLGFPRIADRSLAISIKRLIASTSLV
jgi:hypothetical protein